MESVKSGRCEFLPKTNYFKPYIFATRCRRPFDISNNVVL